MVLAIMFPFASYSRVIARPGSVHVTRRPIGSNANVSIVMSGCVVEILRPDASYVCAVLPRGDTTLSRSPCEEYVNRVTPSGVVVEVVRPYASYANDHVSPAMSVNRVSRA